MCKMGQLQNLDICVKGIPKGEEREKSTNNDGREFPQI